MSRMILTVKPAPKITTIVRGIGQPGPQGATGQGFSQIASGTILGNGLGDPALPQALTGAAARSVMNAASLAGNSFSGKQIFTGTDHVGLCLHSLSTAQYNALAATNGDLFRDSTADRIDARLNRGTVELIDTAGGQTINGNLAATTLMVGGASGPLLRNNGGAIEVRNNANTDLANFTVSQVTANVQVRTNAILRNGVATLTLFNGNVTSNFYAVTIPGSGGALSNSSGVAGWFRIDSAINQTGTAGSTDILVNRTETALGSGEHNFANFQVAGSNRWRVDRLGDMYFHDGVNFTRIARAPGASGRLIIYRPNNAGAIAVQIGGGNDELFVGQGGEGSFRVSGGGVQLGSSGIFLIDSAVNSFNFRGSASTTMATLTGAGNLSTVGTVTIGTYTVGTLPSASANTRARAFVTDSNQTFNSANLGATVTAGGANLVPVFSNGTNWVIG